MKKMFMMGAGLVLMLAACSQQGEEVKMLEKAKGAGSEAEKMATETVTEAGKIATGAKKTGTEAVDQAEKLATGAEKVSAEAVDKAGEMVKGAEVKSTGAMDKTEEKATGAATDAAKKAGELSPPLK